jgi:hypothetical protein
MLNTGAKKRDTIMLTTLSTDMIMIFIMLLGLLPLRFQGRGAIGLVRLLWTQVG